MLRKIVLLFFTLCFSLTLVFAGGRTQAGTGDASRVNESFNPTGYPISKTPITLTFAADNGRILGDPDKLDMMIRLADITNITVKWVLLESAQIDVYYAGGDFPDLFYSTANSQRIQTYGVEGGLFSDWNKYLSYMPNLSWLFEAEPFTRKIVTEMNGEIYALPSMVNASTNVTTRFMVRTDYLDEMGLALPGTIDEFYNACRMALDRGLTKGYAPLVSSFSFYRDRVEPFLFASFGEFSDPGFTNDKNGKVVYNKISEQYKNYLKFMNRLYTEKLFDNEYLTMDLATQNSREKNGQALFGTDMSVLDPEDFPDGQVHLDQVPPLVSQYTNTRKTLGYNTYNYAGGLMPKSNRYTEETARYVDMWYSRDEIVPGSGINNESFVYGILGRDYDFADNGQTLIQRVPDGINLAHGNYLMTYVMPSAAFYFWDKFIIGGTPNSLARQLGYVKNNIPYQELRFPINFMKYNPNEVEVRDLYTTEIETYTAEMRARFIAGIADIDREWDNYVRTVNSMHLNDVLAAYQSAYDRWNSN